MAKLKTAILGSGNIGTDLLIKVMRSPLLECSLFIGRKPDSPGILKAKSLGVTVSDASIDAILKNPDCCKLVFDATSAKDHIRHWPLLKELGKAVIDMTPSNIGHKIVPTVNSDSILDYKNYNMISCGGQASIPLINAFTKVQKDIEYIEVVSSIASRSAGAATRINIDEYIENTEEGIRQFSGCKKTKVMLILNPAEPPVYMHTTISVKVKNPDIENIRTAIIEAEKKIRTYVPGYKVVVPAVYETNRVVTIARVQGLGDYLPQYAGNLDIINCAAISTAERYAKACISKPQDKVREKLCRIY